MRGIGDRKTSVDALKIAPVASGSRTRLATGFSAFLSGICAIFSAQTKTIFLKEKAGARAAAATLRFKFQVESKLESKMGESEVAEY